MKRIRYEASGSVWNGWTLGTLSRSIAGVEFTPHVGCLVSYPTCLAAVAGLVILALEHDIGC